MSSHAAQGVGEGTENGDRAFAPVTLAVIGDTPYGNPQVLDFPGLVRSINDDPKASLVVHVGDIKNGSSRCDDSYFAQIAGYFDSFADPILFTPGDNEWTDCHRATDGKYDPLERLARLRELFYPVPGESLGQSKRRCLDARPSCPGFGPSSRTSCGSNRGWSSRWSTWWAATTTVCPGSATTPPTPWSTIRRGGWPRSRRAPPPRSTGSIAPSPAPQHEKAQAVAIFMQADMWTSGPLDGFNTIAQRLAAAGGGLRAAGAAGRGRFAPLPGRQALRQAAIRSTA